MRVYAGTSGYSYKEWKGPFYPDDLPASGMLSFYASRLGAVEINNTFYRLPKVGVLEKWRETAGPGFRFSIKASRRITHFSRLKETSREPTAYLIETVAALGDALGTLLFQLPPNMKVDPALLSDFLGILPTGLPTAFEFRHPSWDSDKITDILRAHGTALVRSDTDESDVDVPLVATTDWGYLRLRRATYDDVQLASWAKKITACGWDHAFVFFKHEDAGAGPRLAKRFMDVMRGQLGEA